ncbi:MAG: hypothetical protein WKF59_16435 [Chitinophagaceae bacterium]
MLPTTPNEGGSIMGWSTDGKYIYVIEPAKTLQSIYRLSVDGKEIIEWNKGVNDLVTLPSLNHSGSHIGFIQQNSATPAEGYISTISEYKPLRITNINNDIAKLPVAKTEVVRWKGNGGMDIEGLLTYPLNYEKGKNIR